MEKSLHKVSEYLKELKCNPHFFKEISEEYIDDKFCKLAVEANHFVLDFGYIPERFIDENIYLVALNSHKSYSLFRVPEFLRTKSLCFKFIENNGLELFGVPEELKTYELCLKSVENNGLALQYVPEELKLKICYAAVLQNSDALQYIVNPSQELIDFALSCNNKGVPIRFINNKTYKQCLNAVKHKYQSLEYVPKEFLTEELCVAAINKESASITYFKKECFSDEIYSKLLLTAVKKNGLSLMFIESKNQSLPLCLEALKQNFEALKYIKINLPVESVKNNYELITQLENAIEKQKHIINYL